MWFAGAAPLHAQGPDLDPVEFARAFTDGWNASDVDAVLACFAPDAVVRRRGSRGPDEVWDAQDELAVREFLAEEGWRVSLSWVRGAGEIRALMAEAIREHPRVEASNVRSAGHVVTWDYRVYPAALLGLPGVGPVEGVAAGTVRAGRIVRLTLIDDPASIVRQRRPSTRSPASGRGGRHRRWSPAGGQGRAPERVPAHTAAGRARCPRPGRAVGPRRVGCRGVHADLLDETVSLPGDNAGGRLRRRGCAERRGRAGAMDTATWPSRGGRGCGRARVGGCRDLPSTPPANGAACGGSAHSPEPPAAPCRRTSSASIAYGRRNPRAPAPRRRHDRRRAR